METVTGRETARCSSLLQLYYLAYPLFRMDVECPVDFFIRQGAVYSSTHYQTAILKDFLLCVLPALGKHFKHSFKGVLCPYSINSVLCLLIQRVKQPHTNDKR